MSVEEIYGNKIRVRVCGILRENNHILLIKHSGLNHDNEFWSAPGGGLEPRENTQKALLREFKEECGLEVKIEKYLGLHQHIEGFLHAITLYFSCERVSGMLIKGSDPELNIILESKFMTEQDLFALPEGHVDKGLLKIYKQYYGN
jgi:8-oxo-dGTP diphosphatase